MRHDVGCRRWELEDSAKGHTFPIIVMYPTSSPAQETAFGPFTLMVAMEAPVTPGRFPLVVISHGSSSSPLVFRTLAQTLTASGYVVCLPQHPFDNTSNNTLQYTLDNLVGRPRHIGMAIDAIAADPRLGSFVDVARTAVIGHSVGGYTALAVGGGRPHTAALVEFSNRWENLDQPYWTAIVRRNRLSAGPVDTAADPRVKALVLLAPDLSLFMHDDALAEVRAPVLLRVAEKDLWPREIIDVVRKGVGDPSVLDSRIIENASHYAFISPFPEALKSKVGEAGADPAGFDRAAFQFELASDILMFLQRHGLRTVGVAAPR